MKKRLQNQLSKDHPACEFVLPHEHGERRCVGLPLPSHTSEYGVPDEWIQGVDVSNSSGVGAHGVAIAHRIQRELGLLAHEMRNPLATIRSGLKILEMSPTADQIKNIQGMMKRQLDHVIGMVQNLFDLTRIQEGRLVLNQQPTSVAEVIHIALESSGESIKKGKHFLQVTIEEDLPDAHIDGPRIAQVIANLLDNASKYTPDGGEIALDVCHNNQLIELRVRDNGLGIAPHRQEQIFKLFVQEKDHQPYSRGGLGVGLFLVKTIVDDHGGSIHVKSDGEGKGCEFLVKLPAVKR